MNQGASSKGTSKRHHRQLAYDGDAAGDVLASGGTAPPRLLGDGDRPGWFDDPRPGAARVVRWLACALTLGLVFAEEVVVAGRTGLGFSGLARRAPPGDRSLRSLRDGDGDGDERPRVTDEPAA